MGLSKEMVQLDANGELSVQEQLAAALMFHNKTVLQLFQGWDQNGDGGISLKEFRKVIAALGYKASKEEVKVLFTKLAGDDEPDYINYNELKAALSRFMRRATTASKTPKPPPGPPPADPSPKRPE